MNSEWSNMVDSDKVVEGSELKPDLSNWDKEDPARSSSKQAWLTLWITTYSLFLGFCVWFMVSAIAPEAQRDRFRSIVRAALLAHRDSRSVRRSSPLSLHGSASHSGNADAGGAVLSALHHSHGWVVLRRSGYEYIVRITDVARGTCAESAVDLLRLHAFYWILLPETGSRGLRSDPVGMGNLGMSDDPTYRAVAHGIRTVWASPSSPRCEVMAKLWVFNAAIFSFHGLLSPRFLLLASQGCSRQGKYPEQLDIFSNKNTWYMTLLYVMTFGIYSLVIAAPVWSDYSKQFRSTSQFAGHGLTGLPQGVTYAFLGPLICSLVRVMRGGHCVISSGVQSGRLCRCRYDALGALSANLQPSSRQSGPVHAIPHRACLPSSCSPGSVTRERSSRCP